ncbi:MAG TPA: hypothetical protein PLB89_04990 [Flavobacteriales bacterium]|nr:hypothetical protein [Flavobacteriales bacterium]
MRKSRTPRLTSKRRRKALRVQALRQQQRLGQFFSRLNSASLSIEFATANATAALLGLEHSAAKVGELVRLAPERSAMAIGELLKVVDLVQDHVEVFQRKLVPMNHVFKMRNPRCPICGGQLLVQVYEWQQDAHDPKADVLAGGIEVDCEHEPDIDTDEWDEWHRGHYSRPYVDWLPVETALLEWIQKNYRFPLEAMN